MKRLLSLAVLGLFVAAFAAHPAVHAEDRGAHACLLGVTGPDRPAAPAAFAGPLAVFAGRVSAPVRKLPRAEGVRPADARAPPL